MEKKLVIFALLAIVALVAAAWNYKGNDLEDNQVLVFLTGTDVSSQIGETNDEIPEIVPGASVNVRVDGTTANCVTTHFTKDSKAIGQVQSGSLQNGVTFRDNPYLKLSPAITGAYATSELINTLEIASCTVMSGFETNGPTGRINDLSSQNGGRLVYDVKKGLAHTTHQNGLDGDLAFFCSDPGNKKVYDCGDASKFNVAAMWLFVRTLAEKTPVRRIYLDQRLINKLQAYINSYEPGYPLKNKIFIGPNRLLVHVNGHYNHIHVNIHCPKNDLPNCKESGGFRGPTGEIDVEPGDTEGGETFVASADETPVAGAHTDEELLALADKRASKCLYFEEIDPIIESCSQRYGINSELIKAILMWESYGPSCNYNGGKPRAVSKKDAMGLMQLLKIATVEDNRFRTKSTQETQLTWGEDTLKPARNICGGAQLLAIYWAQYKTALNLKNTGDLLQAYNLGYGNYRDGERNTDYVSHVEANYLRLTGQPLPTNPEITPGSATAVGKEAAPAVVS